MQFLYQYQMYSPVLATLIYWCQTGSVNRIKRRATYQISQVSLAVNHQPKNIWWAWHCAKSSVPLVITCRTVCCCCILPYLMDTDTQGLQVEERSGKNQVPVMLQFVPCDWLDAEWVGDWGLFNDFGRKTFPECVSSGCSQASAQLHYTAYISAVSIYFTSSATSTFVSRK